MARIFISYSRVDRPFVNDLIPLLREVYGFDNVWFDANLYGGQDWWEEILSQIAASDILVYLLSNESIESEYCKAELQEARRLQKQILPVLIRARARIPDDLQRIQSVDMSEGITSRGLNGFHAAVSRLSTQIPTSPPPPLTPRPVPVPLVTPSTSKRRALNKPRAIIIVAIIAVLLVFVLIAALNNSGSESPTATNTPTVQEFIVAPSETEDLPIASQTLDSSPTSTATPSPSPTSTLTLSPTFTLATGVTLPSTSRGNCQSIDFGSMPHNGNLTTPAQQDCYSFAGSSGDIILVRVISTSGGRSAVAEIVQPDGDTICEAATVNEKEITCVLRNSGDHIAVVKDFFGSGREEYALYIQRLSSPDQCTTIDFSGAALTESILVAAEVDCFTFAGNGGDRIQVRVASTSGTLALDKSVRDPNGTLLCEAGITGVELTCDLQVNGIHTLYIKDFFGTGTGDYGLSLGLLN